MELETGVNTQESAAPAESQSSSPDTGATSGAATQIEGSAAKETQQQPEPAFDKNAFAAEVRRSTQKEEAQRYQRQRDQDAQERGYKDYGDWLRSHDEQRRAAAVEKLNQELQASASIAPETFNAAVQAFTQRTAQIEQQYADEVGQQAANRDMASEFGAFAATPDYASFGVKAATDLPSLPGWSKMQDLIVNKGFTIVEAMEFVNREPLLKIRTDAAKQAALNSVNSKNHMKPADGGNEGLDSVVVPEETARWYRTLNPKMTTKQMHDNYAEFLRDSKNAT